VTGQVVGENEDSDLEDGDDMDVVVEGGKKEDPPDG
jgi:hypothetical protein